jgi:hypothetical protein
MSNLMAKIDKDIIDKINQLFDDKRDKNEIVEIFSRLTSKDLNVGVNQIARCLLVLSDGDIEIIKTIIRKDFYGDPRDIILLGEKKLGYPGHYFLKSFDEFEG